MSFIDAILIIPMAVLWAFLPNDGIAFVTQWFLSTVSSLVFELPYSRLMEKEADEVGLTLVANACYDIREAPVYWGKLGLDENENEKEKFYRPQFLRTYPL